MRLTRRWPISIAISSLTLALLAFFAWPWLSIAPKKLRPLGDYLVYDETLDPLNSPGSNWASWRKPASRTELLLLPEHRVYYVWRPLEKPVPPPRSRRIIIPDPPIEVLTDDELVDFVIDDGQWYRHPESWDELKEFRYGPKIQRTSVFFSKYRGWDKPFLGEVPTWMCKRQTQSNLQIPDQPRVCIVADVSPENVQKALSEQSAAVSYQYRPFVAIVYAGWAYTGSREFVIDRVTVGKESTEIVLYNPSQYFAETDRSPYWFAVPLGMLPDGPYAVNVRLLNDDSIWASTTTQLSRATPDQEAAYNKYLTEQQQSASKSYTQKKALEQKHGAILQLQLERLARFVNAAIPTVVDQDLLSNDVRELGRAVDWGMNVFGEQRSSRFILEPPLIDSQSTAGKRPSQWQPTKISLKDIWLCDGTDADWYAKKTYRDEPALNGALETEEPTPVQKKIRAIWTTLKERPKGTRTEKLRSFVASGSIEDAVDTVHEVIVHGGDAKSRFAPGERLWAVFIADGSYLIRKLGLRHFEDKYRPPSQRTTYSILTSAYFGAADGPSAEPKAPVTFALIPLESVNSDRGINYEFACAAVSCRGTGPEPELIDANPPGLMINDFRWRLCYGKYFVVAGTAPLEHSKKP